MTLCKFRKQHSRYLRVQAVACM